MQMQVSLKIDATRKTTQNVVFHHLIKLNLKFMQPIVLFYFRNCSVQQCLSSSSSQLNQTYCLFHPPQSHCSPPFSQPPCAGHPQRLSHVRQYGLDRPVAPRCRRSHGGFAWGSAGLRTGTSHARSRRTERTYHLEQTQILTQTNSSSRAWKYVPIYPWAASFEIHNYRHIFCQTVLKRHAS